MIMDTPPTHYIAQPLSAEMRLASDERLNDIMRGVLIDRITSRGGDPELIPKLLTLYNETHNIEVKSKIIEGLMLYNQQHRQDPTYTKQDQPRVKAFFETTLQASSINSKSTDATIRGFIDTHSVEEIQTQLETINTRLLTIDHYSSVMLKYTLAFQSKTLQPIYIRSITQELQAANNADLDSYLFGPLSIGYAHSGKDLLGPEARQIVLDYLALVHHKYTAQGIKANPKDFHRQTTAPYYFELRKNMGVETISAP